MNLEKIPQNPGCYIFLDKQKKIIYVGKAKNLRKRVLSYFNKKDLDSKTEALVGQIKEIDFIITKNELEALLLENNLIKKNNPKYNINLKDSKSFAFLEITGEEFPRLIFSRSEKVKKEKNKRNLFGPFVSASVRDSLLVLLNKTFKLRTCVKLPKRKCIRYDLGICSAPCVKKISKKDYLSDIRKVEFVLRGKTSELIEKLEKEMKNFSLKNNFEKALVLRDQISSLKYLKEKQRVERNKEYDEDIINYLVKDEKVYLILFNIHRGLLENKQTFEFDYVENFLEEFLIQFYSENPIPKVLILPEKIGLLSDYLSLIKNSKVKILIPQKGELRDLLELAKKNIELQYFGEIKKLEELMRKLNLQSLPQVIECFDISHLGGTEVVASMVQFRNGKPDKSNYRKFKIKSGDRNDDFLAMNEVVKRRYSRLKLEGKSFPDLILIDGGLGQLNSSIRALDEIGVKIPIISLAKKFEEVYLPGEEVLQLGEKSSARKLLEAIRNEAHRFAVKYQRERRRKSYFKK